MNKIKLDDIPFLMERYPYGWKHDEGCIIRRADGVKRGPHPRGLPPCTCPREYVCGVPGCEIKGYH